MPNPFISLKIINKNGEMISKVRTRKTKRVFRYIQAEKSVDCMFKLCVTYGKGFTNEGVYTTKKNLIHALKAFTEK